MITESTYSKKTVLAGRIISGICVLFLLFDSITKIIKVAPVVEANIRLGYSENLVPIIGILLLCCTLLYIVPSTAVLGAIILTGYLGGATATLVRVGDPFFFPVVMGLLVWIGLFLRNERLRALIPIIKEEK